ncbi:glycosyltransferase family 2 protein [Candidatus Woesearchaeota archaeon]|nr:glycosyltransferase family 2 protein [Candidatus Woesearchaeota archaeon]MCF8012939.1 glycosyltransferase family 2 protein [Candidatus Woesearchaeota archaeon]
MIDYSLKRLTKNKYNLLINDAESNNADFTKIKKLAKRKNIILFNQIKNLKGSIAHGTALNELAKKISSPYFCILDADAVWLKKNWDEILINELNNKVKVIGTQPSKPKPQDFPLMYAILFETKTFKKLNIDFRPKDIKAHLDTGHDLRDKYIKAGYKGEVLEFRNTRHYKKGPFKNLICAEYYLPGEKRIFASHFGRGSSLGVNKYMHGKGSGIIPRIPFIAKYLAKIRGKYEKYKWIKKCKEIIDDQNEKK